MNRKTVIDTLKQQGGFITTGEVKSRGEYEQLRRAIEDGTLMRLRKGVYVEMSALANNMIDVERIVPHGVLCLYSAFAHYGLSTQVPSATCIAIEDKRKVRLPDYPPIDLYYWKKENLEFGIIKKSISGYDVLITDMERTVCDAVKYRNKIGLDVCGEVIDNYLKKENRNISLLHEYAQKLRVKNIMTTYLETRLLQRITPYPLSLDYPLLLPDVPAVELYAYSLETLIAEKFHAMVDRDESNSRMKDFFDVYQLFTNHEIDKELLAEAIVGTFKNRNTPYRENLALFTDKFATDATRNIWWKAFLKKIRWKEQIDFSVVMKCIKENLQAYWNKETLG